LNAGQHFSRDHVDENRDDSLERWKSLNQEEAQFFAHMKIDVEEAEKP